MTSHVRTADRSRAGGIHPVVPPADLADPVTARKNLARLAATAPPTGTRGMRVEDRTVPADPDVPVRTYRPDQADVAAIYPTETYRRLAAVKGRYDPGNLFAGNHNVRPSPAHPLTG